MQTFHQNGVVKLKVMAPRRWLRKNSKFYYISASSWIWSYLCYFRSYSNTVYINIKKRCPSFKNQEIPSKNSDICNSYGSRRRLRKNTKKNYHISVFLLICSHLWYLVRYIHTGNMNINLRHWSLTSNFNFSKT